MIDITALVFVRLICTIIAVLPFLVTVSSFDYRIDTTFKRITVVATVIWFAVWFAPTANALLSTAWRSAL